MTIKLSAIRSKTWLEINKANLQNNINIIRRLIGPKVKLLAVIKSNAYGHGLTVMAELAAKNGVAGFCVDSVVEGSKLRQIGIKQDILVLGSTLPYLYAEAAANNLVITISSLEALNELIKSKIKPNFHLKFDTGMHRQGFYPEMAGAVIKLIKAKPQNVELVLTGRKASPQVIKLADYVTEFKEVKHPYQKGSQARLGIEY